MSSSSSRSRRHGRQASVTQLIESLSTRRVSTLTELCRIEVIAASASAEDQERFQEPMTSAWSYYVNSNNLLNDLRGLTRNYPFSSECLDEAKYLVLNDPLSNRSWNFAWLVLVKMQDKNLIEQHAAESAANPDMWGGRTPEQSEADQLAECFVWEWEDAVRRLLLHWNTAPTTTGE